MKKLLVIICVLLLGAGVSGCIKTSEDIRLDKELSDLQTKVDLNNEQVNARIGTEVASIRKGQVDMLSRIDSSGDDIKDLRNRLDILQHRLDNLRQDLDLFTTTGGTMNSSVEQRLAAIETSMTAVEAWMSFSSAYNSSKTATRHTESVSKQAGLSIDDAVKLFKDNRLDEAKPVFEKISKSGNTEHKTRAIFYLGEIAYREKDYKTAIADYGIIVEKYPASPLIKDAYFMIGKSFVNLGDKKNAKLFFEELVSKYPDDKFAKDARKELKKLR